jgi:hypothetical protein
MIEHFDKALVEGFFECNPEVEQRCGDEEKSRNGGHRCDYCAAGKNDIRAEKPHCPRCKVVMQALCLDAGRAFMRMSAGCFSEGM